MAEASPVALAFFSWQGAKPKVSLGNRAWRMLRDQMPEVMMIAPVAALAHHRIQAAGRERRKLLQRLVDERQIGIDLRGPLHGANPGQCGRGEHTLDGAAVHVQLARDSAATPLLDVVVAQDLRFEFSSNGHGSFPVEWVAVRTSRKTRRRSGPRRTKPEHTKLQKWQCSGTGAAVTDVNVPSRVVKISPRRASAACPAGT